MRNIAITSALLLLPTLGLVSAGSANAAPTADARSSTSTEQARTPCNQGLQQVVRRGSTRVFDRINGLDSDYNDGVRDDEVTVTFSRTYTRADTKNVTVSAGGGINWGIVSAKIDATYGNSTTKSLAVSSSVSKKVTIPPRYTGWMRAVVYQKNILWTGWTERWNASKGRCVRVNVKKGTWGDLRYQRVSVVKKGHHYPGKTGTTAIEAGRTSVGRER